MNSISLICIIVLVAMLIPVVLFVSAKMVAYGFFLGRLKFKQDYSEKDDEGENDESKRC